ncbi:MAG TPA: xylosidase [Marinilabiliales bacterium]|nr:MAG: xylosidase [Bacteroidetes bacterium GWD2_40_43]OFX91621.1 MAG: xylosidase [Bacteroidetes bacterium GWE2_40_63]OFY24401.1 MAG: xylosidase [Bacteroidetes bacterium GWF2_40_13]HAM97946.1 xylosidase [Marinilabiliales bacterium]HBX86976.1 xylosidase [Marinilabiliales bacterium]
MKKKLGASFLVLLFAIVSEAQTYQKTESGFKTQINKVNVEVLFYSPSIIRVVKYPEGMGFEKQSLSVVLTPQKTPFTIKQQDGGLVLKSEKLQVSLDFKSGKISFANHSAMLLSEKETGASFVDFNDAGNKTYAVSQSFILEKDEAIYGLGQQQQGKMSQRNTKLYMVQNNIEDFIPFFLSSKAYGVFWDNYSPTVFEDNAEGTSFKSDVGDGIDYYFMAGENADGVIANMRSLTGQAPMFPLWTFGFWQSRERYKTQDELTDVVKNFRELGVPLDGIIQDWQYWGSNYLWNAMEFLNPGFYGPQKMVNDVHDMNAHLIISIWNSFGPMTKQYRELNEIGALFNFVTWPQSGSEKWPPNPDYPSGVRVYDAYNPQARDIYWKYLNEGVFKLGMDGWWIDSSEPDHLDPKPSDFDTKTYLGSFRKVRNAFPLMTVGGVSEHQRTITSDKRVFILTRSAFAGQQRYGANTWSGDVVASWDALRNQISAGLNFSLCGIPYWNSDLGGFFLWNFKNPLENVDYRELHVRWIEFGTFCPMMRSHGEGFPREIYQFGKKGSPVYDAIEKYINLRYSLLPYIYSASWDVTANQSSIMRALVMDFAADKQALDINDEFMFDKSLLVSPVTKPMYWKNEVKGNDTVKVEDYSTIETKEVYLPKGADWYDFWTGDKFNGGQTVNKEVPLDIIPLFVKAGAIIPIGPMVQFATQKKWDNLEIRVYEGTNGEFTLYEDENDNYNYEKGAYSTIIFSWNNTKRVLTISDRKGSFPGMLAERKFNIVLVSKSKGIGSHAGTTFDKEVNYNGEKVVVKL